MKHNKVALVTGGSKGIGKAIAVKLAARGDTHVCLASRNEENLARALQQLSTAGDLEHMSIPGDVSVAGSEDEVIDRIIQKFGKIDMLVNNSGGPAPGSFLEKSVDDWNFAISNNMMSVIRYTKKAAPLMVEQGWGRILNITSTLAKEPTPNMALSATVRASVSAFTKAISSEIAMHGVTINTILPGGVLTDRLDSLIAAAAEKNGISKAEQLQQNQAQIPIGRFAQPDEIAAVAAFLLSEDAGYVTGQSWVVDGGLTKSFF